MRNDFETGYLEHSAKGTSWTKKGAKYIKRFIKNGKYVYEYAKEGIKADKRSDYHVNERNQRSWYSQKYPNSYWTSDEAKRKIKDEAQLAERNVAYGTKMEAMSYRLAVNTYGETGGKLIYALLYKKAKRDVG